MAERIWSKPALFARYAGDREAAQRMERTARAYVGYLFDQLEARQTYRTQSWRFSDGSWIKAHVWRDVLGERAAVTVFVPPVEPEKPQPVVVLGLILLFASNDALYGFGEKDPNTGQYLVIASGDKETSPLWLWSGNNKLTKFNNTGYAWNAKVFTEPGQLPYIVSLGKSMVGGGTQGDLRLNESLVLTAFPYAYAFCYRKITIASTSYKVIIVAGQFSNSSNDVLTLRFYSFASFTYLGTATITGLTNWGENKDTAYVRYVAFSKSGQKIAILVTSTLSGNGLFSSSFAEAAVFEANISSIQPGTTTGAALIKEAVSDIINTETVTQQSTIVGREDEEIVTYFAAEGTYESPFMLYWDNETLRIWSAGVRRDYACGFSLDGYGVPLAPGENSWSEFIVAAFGADTGSTCTNDAPGFWGGYYAEQGACWYVKHDAKDEIDIYIKLDDAIKHTHELYKYVNLADEGSGGIPPWPDVIAGETTGCIGDGPRGDPYSFAFAVSEWCQDWPYLDPPLIEFLYFGVTCQGQAPRPGIHLFGRGEVDQFLISPLLFMQESTVSFIRGGSVTELYYDSYMSPDSIPQEGTTTNYQYNDAMFLETSGRRFSLGERAAPKIGITQLYKVEQFTDTLVSTLKARFLTEPEDVAGLAKSFGTVPTQWGTTKLALITANNKPHSMVREGQLVEFAGGGVIHHSIFGEPPGFPANVQVCFNSTAPDYYTGTATKLVK